MAVRPRLYREHNKTNNQQENTVTTETTDGKEKRKLGPCSCITPEFRASYVTLYEARSVDPAEPNKKNYGVEMWFRVKDTPESLRAGEKCVNIQALTAAAEAACAEKWGPDKAKWPKGLKNPFKNGDLLTGKNGAVPGCIIVRASRKESFGPPGVVDQAKHDILDKKVVYSGCYGRAVVHAYAWKHPTGGFGVSFTLDHFQLIRDGEPLGNRLEAQDAFDAIPIPGGGDNKVAGAGDSQMSGGVFGELA